jgi:hypothetical protein
MDCVFDSFESHSPKAPADFGGSSHLFASGKKFALQHVRSACQPPDSGTFLSERTSHEQPAATSQQYSSLRTNQHQPSATSQPNRLLIDANRG